MPIQSGWANNSGIELFTIGWVQELLAIIRAACLPIVGDSWLANCPEQHYTHGWICCKVIQPPIPPVKPGDVPGRGSGPTHGIREEGYNKHREDALRETRRLRILQEDEDLIALIVSMVTKDLM